MMQLFFANILKKMLPILNLLEVAEHAEHGKWNRKILMYTRTNRFLALSFTSEMQLYKYTKTHPAV